MNILGELALWTALPVSLWGMVLGFAGGRKQRGDLTLSAERSVYAVFITARYPATIQWARQNDRSVLLSAARQYNTFQLSRLFRFDVMSERLGYKSLIDEDEEDSEPTDENASDTADQSTADAS